MVSKVPRSAFGEVPNGTGGKATYLTFVVFAQQLLGLASYQGKEGPCTFNKSIDKEFQKLHQS